jgi:hypothetical protein
MMSPADLEAHIMNKLRIALQTNDFEEVMKTIDACNELLEVYHGG